MIEAICYTIFVFLIGFVAGVTVIAGITGNIKGEK